MLVALCWLCVGALAPGVENRARLSDCTADCWRRGNPQNQADVSSARVGRLSRVQWSRKAEVGVGSCCPHQMGDTETSLEGLPAWPLFLDTGEEGRQGGG